MAKQGQHHNDANDQNIARCLNKPKQSTIITTGTYKKPETYKLQAAMHQDPGKKAQAAKPLWHPDTRELLTHEADSAKRAHDRTKRTGSDSNADKATRRH
jgi:hypothetical protein